MIIRLPLPTYPVTLTGAWCDPCITPSSPRIERLDGPAGKELRLSLGRSSLYLSAGWLPRT